MTKTDRIVRKMALERELALAERRKRPISLPRGPGNTCIGSVHDCSRTGFERALRAYWDKLFVGWNPYKNEGRGCWEVWQYPSKKTAVLRYDDEKTNTKIYTLESVFSDYLHWVADLDYLSYSFIKKLREMDAWENKQLISGHDDKYEEHFQKLEKEEDENIKYVVKHNRTAFKDLLEYTQAGFDPLQFFTKNIKR